MLDADLAELYGVETKMLNRAVNLNAALNCQPTRQRVKDVLHGIGRPRLSLGEIRRIALPVPPEGEQQRAVAEIDRRLSLLRESEAQVNSNFKRIERLRQSILTQAFIGKVNHLGVGRGRNNNGK